ncbi:hypothetical protein TcWFU_001711 [Taenia crassiceps]|uniref:Uncharacterized protein n=1 Tax=Taenia crassiceps TaxID=6207 RepID=A0ABR4QCK7_9CEST
MIVLQIVFGIQTPRMWIILIGVTWDLGVTNRFTLRKQGWLFIPRKGILWSYTWVFDYKSTGRVEWNLYLNSNDSLPFYKRG